MRILAVLLISPFLFAAQDAVPITAENAAQVEAINTLQITDSFARTITFDPTNSTRLAVAQADGFVSLWEIPTGELVANWQVATGIVNGLAYTPDGQQLVTADADGNVIVWDANSYEELQAMNVEGEIPLLLDTAQNNMIAVGYEDGTVRIWDANTGEQKLSLFGYNSPVYALDMTSDGTRLAFGYSIGDVFVYRLDDIEQQHIYIESILKARELNDLAFFPQPLPNEFISSIGLATVSNFVSAQLHDALYPAIQGSVETESAMAYPNSLSFNHDGSLLAVGGKSTTGGGGCDINICPIEIIQTYYSADTRTFSVLATLERHLGWIQDVAFSPDDRFIASASSDGIIFVWGVRT